MHHDRARKYGRIAAGVLVAWVLIVGAITGIGKLIMIIHNGNGNLLGDHAIPHWFAAQRTAALNHWSLIASNLGATQDILIVSVVACVVFVAVTRRWRPVIFLAVVMFGELAAFLTVAAIVKRPRPDVPHLDSNLPTSAFPSGHMAATTCLYVGIAILVIGYARGWWRYLFLIPAIVMPVMIAVARMYRGEHHPTDILGSVLFAGLWLTATTMLIKPNAGGLDRAGRRPLGLPRRKAADRSRNRARNPLAADTRDDQRLCSDTSVPAGRAAAEEGLTWPARAPGSGSNARSCAGGSGGRATHRPGDRPDPSRPAGTDMLPQIKHIVVLMMENHSFDNYLGTLGRGEGFPLGDDGAPDAENPDSAGTMIRAYHAQLHRAAGAGRALPELERQPRPVGRRQDERFRDLDRAGRARG